MDRLDQMRLLVRVVERSSFRAAAADLHIARSSATTAIRDLEKGLGAQLLKRTTRHVVPTLEGEAYVKRCRAILLDIDDAESEMAGKAVRGVIRVAMNGPMARSLILPRLPAFLDEYPDLTVHISESDRFVDVVREGYDCVIRAGEIADSELIGKKLGEASEVTLCSPGYLNRYGMPASIDDLDRHMMVGFSSSKTGNVLPLEFMVDGLLIAKALPVRICVNGAESYAAAGRLGFGLIQVPRYRYADEIAAGTLVEILTDHPPGPLAIMVLYPAGRQLASRVRLFVDWLGNIVGPQLVSHVP